MRKKQVPVLNQDSVVIGYVSQTSGSVGAERLASELGFKSKYQFGVAMVNNEKVWAWVPKRTTFAKLISITHNL
jgi:hypothetical protein